MVDGGIYWDVIVATQRQTIATDLLSTVHSVDLSFLLLLLRAINGQHVNAF